jgi:hypothetical protein
MTNMGQYEPLYVAKGETPAFDERFIGFGMTRNTQVRNEAITLFLIWQILIPIWIWTLGTGFINIKMAN